MSQQGEQDDWWSELYDPEAPDTGRTRASDTLDDRFASVTHTVGPDTAPALPSPRAPEASGSEPSSPEASLPEPYGAPDEASDAPAPEVEADAGPGPEPTMRLGTLPDDAATPRPAGSGREGEEPPATADVTPPDAELWAEPVPGAPEPDFGPAPDAPAPEPGEGAATESVPGTPPAEPAPEPEPDPAPTMRFGTLTEAGPVPEQQGSARAEPSGPEVPAAPEPEPAAPVAPVVAELRGARVGEGAPGQGVAHVGVVPPSYDPEPAALPLADPAALGELVPDTVLDGAQYGTLTLRAASLRGDAARHRAALREETLLTARFGEGDEALLLVAVAAGPRGTAESHRAAREVCQTIGGAVGRSHARLSEDIRDGRRGALKSGLNRLTDRAYGKLRAQAAARGLGPDEFTADLRCLLLPADPHCSTRVYFGVGPGGLFRLREGEWQDIEPAVPDEQPAGGPVLSYGAEPLTAGTEPGGSGPVTGPGAGTLTDPGADPRTEPRDEAPGAAPPDPRATMQLGPSVPEEPLPPGFAPAGPGPRPFRFRASVAQKGDTLLLCSTGLAEPLRGESGLADELAARWAGRSGPPGLAAFLSDVQLRVRGYADDRTAVAVWES